MSADTVSSLFPDRPIRPLPKRRLRERLSPDVADSIQYPPAPQSTTPLFYYPYSPRDDEPEPSSLVSREHDADARNRHARSNGLGLDSDDDEAGLRRSAASRAMSELLARTARVSVKQDSTKHVNSQPPPSAASPADAYYDPFEITNNKKKRKIPTAGDVTLNGSHGMQDAMHGGESPGTPIQSIEGHEELSSLTSNYYRSGVLASSNPNISGPGRGRYGRARNGRSPLRALSDSSSNWAGRNGKLRPSQWISPSAENTGIISTAIANAEKHPSHPGQENLSLLEQQQRPAKPDPATTQFTFTCDSQVPGGVAWPGADRRHTMDAEYSSASAPREAVSRLSAPATYAYSAQPTKQTPDSAAQTAPAKPSGPGQPPTGATQPKKSRRQLNKELAQAAKKRQQDAAFKLQRSPSADTDFWLCEFCEYEAIFGRPPRAMIRLYELKARRQKKEEEERKRRLEKARSRSRKVKKSIKPAAPDTTTPSQDRSTPQVGAGTYSAAHVHGQATESEDYYDEEDYDNREQSEGASAAADEGHGGGSKTEGHRPLRPPTATGGDNPIQAGMH